MLQLGSLDFQPQILKDMVPIYIYIPTSPFSHIFHLFAQPGPFELRYPELQRDLHLPNLPRSSKIPFQIEKSQDPDAPSREAMRDRRIPCFSCCCGPIRWADTASSGKTKLVAFWPAAILAVAMNALAGDGETNGKTKCVVFDECKDLRDDLHHF